MIILRTSLHDKNILALTLLRVEKILFFKLNAIVESLRRDEGFSYFTSLREILNDQFLNIWIPKKNFENRSVKIENTFFELY